VSQSDTNCLFNKSKAIHIIYIQHKNLLERLESGAGNKQAAGRDASIRRFWKNQRNAREMGE